MEIWGGEDSQQGSSWQTQRGGGLHSGAGEAAQLADPVAPHSCIDDSGGMAGEQNRPRNPGLQLGEIKPQTSD